MINKEIDHGKEFDWGLASKDYAKYRDIYPDLFYQKIIELGLCTKGQRVLDLGTGTGVLPRNLYRYGASFVGADISENQIAEAKKLSAGMQIDYLVSSAEKLDFPKNSFDVITACQCFLYFDQSVVIPKIYELLRDNGHFCILFMAWLPDESEIARHSEELVLQYNPSWTGAHMKRGPLTVPQSTVGYFDVEHAITYDVPVTFTRESWNGRIKACRGIGASALSADEVAAFEAEHLQYLSTIAEPFDILHYVTVLNLRKRSI